MTRGPINDETPCTMHSATARLEALEREGSSPPPVPDGPYLVAGLARAGDAAIRALSGIGHHPVAAWDGLISPDTRRRRRQLQSEGIPVSLGPQRRPDELLHALRPGCIVKSPGIPPYTPVIAEAVAERVTLIDELELGWRLARAPVVAVTGTNGKSTVAALIHAVLKHAGTRSALVGNTLYGPPLSAAPNWASALVCEVSSYQLETCPKFLPAVGVFTNLSRDHLHRHGSMARYAACKRGVFRRDGRSVRLAVINADDPFGRRLAHEVQTAGGRCVLYGTHPSAHYRIRSCAWTLTHNHIAIETPRGCLDVRPHLPGSHNASNVAAALALAGALGVADDCAKVALEEAEAPPGRFEIVVHDRPFDVIVDYAHSPDGFKQALDTARRILDHRRHRRLRVVAGTVGGHDPAEQHRSGQVLRSKADELVLTTSNLRGERPLPIVQDMLRGARSVFGGNVRVVLNRRAAIGETLAEARPGDLVLVLGRGPLTRQMIDRSGIWHEFDDRAVVRALLGADASALRALPEPQLSPA
jgi:UDP-N-acetylmuramoyl-L-alanyl-D-glutamate--2,6-diaminopimelate ligase